MTNALQTLTKNGWATHTTSLDTKGHTVHTLRNIYSGLEWKGYDKNLVQFSDKFVAHR